MIIKTEPTEFEIPYTEIKVEEKPIRVSRSPELRRHSRRIEVLLPTRRQLYGHNPPAFENASRFIAENNLDGANKDEETSPIIVFLPYVKVEIKKEEMLSEDVVNRRIALVAPYDVGFDPAIRDVTTSRIFTSKRWGGNTQSTFPSIRPDMLARHGLNDFMYLNLFFNPHAPQRPGAPGLFFDPGVEWEAPERPGFRRVLVRLKSNCWLYVGQYQCTPALSLSTEEWKSQAPKVKQTWSNKVSTHGWAREVRAKVVLQKRLGRNPTAEELQDAMDANEKFHATPEEIRRAFDEGHIFLLSWCMRCVGYDENFQREIAAGNAAT